MFLSLLYREHLAKVSVSSGGQVSRVLTEKKEKSTVEGKKRLFMRATEEGNGRTELQFSGAYRAGDGGAALGGGRWKILDSEEVVRRRPAQKVEGSVPIRLRWTKGMTGYSLSGKEEVPNVPRERLFTSLWGEGGWGRSRGKKTKTERRKFTMAGDFQNDWRRKNREWAGRGNGRECDLRLIRNEVRTSGEKARRRG